MSLGRKQRRNRPSDSSVNRCMLVIDSLICDVNNE
jgi:hypothetical protein